MPYMANLPFQIEFSDDEPSVAEVAEHSAWTDRSEVHSPVLSTVIIRYWPFPYKWVACSPNNFPRHQSRLLVCAMSAKQFRYILLAIRNGNRQRSETPQTPLWLGLSNNHLR